ncbi:MAG: aspartate--tRNA(Asn) ligase [Candidatus Nealsonbacteria bacterium]
MKRILNVETIQYLNEKVKVSGWLNTRRDHGGIVFLDLRDRSGLLQVVCASNLAKDLKEEYVIEIEGIVQKRPEKMVNDKMDTGEIELKAEKVNVIAKSAPLTIDLQNLNLTLPLLLDQRPLTLRNKKIRSVFKIEETAISAFRETMKKSDFTEFEAPIIVPSATEGGAELFSIKYYDYQAFLAQSPQLYKQILVGVFERVFTVTKVFRAEPSITTRHLSEYISLDAEMGFIESWEDIIQECELMIKAVFSAVQENNSKELEILKASLPKIEKDIPRLKMREAQEIIFKRTKRDNRKEKDLTPDDEKEICKFAEEKYGSELIFITHYPTEKRPFYTYPDPDDPKHTLSFDLLCRGLEIVTGGQRINDYEQLLKSLKKRGNKPQDFKFYLQAFKYGLPREGGFALGAERLVKQILNLDNVREASLFPRDMTRIDQRLSIFKKKKK